MILGYLVIDRGGAIIIEKDILKLVSDNRKSFFSSLLRVVVDLSEDILKSKVKQVSLKDFELYFGFSRHFLVVLISDVKEKFLENAANLIADTLDLLNITSIELQTNRQIREMILQEIEKIINHLPQPLKYVRKISYAIFQARKVRVGRTLDIEGDFTPVRKEPSKKSKPVKTMENMDTEKADLDDLIDEYYRGNFEKVLKTAPHLFEREEAGDLAKILYVKAAINLHKQFGRKSKVNLGQVYSLIKEIQDEQARNFLYGDFLSLYNVKFFKQYIYGLRKNFSAIRNRVNKKTAEGKVYCILLSPCHYGPIREHILNTTGEKINFVFAENKLFEIWEEMHTRRPRSLDEVLSILGELKSHMEKFGEKEDSKYLLPFIASYVYAHVLMLLANNHDLKYPIEVLDQALRYFLDIINNVLEGKINGKYSDFALLSHFAINIIYRVLLFFDEEKYRKMIDFLEPLIMKIISKILEGLRENKIELIYYYLTITGFLSTLSRMASIRGYYYDNFHRILLEIINEDFEEVFYFDKYIYSHFYAFLLDTLGNLAIFIEKDVERINLLKRIACEFRRLMKSYENYPLIHDFTALFAIRYYMATGREEDKEKTYDIISNLRADSPSFLYGILKNVFLKEA